MSVAVQNINNKATILYCLINVNICIKWCKRDFNYNVYP